MCNVIKASSNEENALCPICFDGFDEKEDQWTHEGGEKHATFHRICLRDWIFIKPECPIDRRRINRNSILTRTEKISNCFLYAVTTSALLSSSALTGVALISLPFTEEMNPTIQAVMQGAQYFVFFTLTASITFVAGAIFDHIKLKAIDRENIAIGSFVCLQCSILSLLANLGKKPTENPTPPLQIVLSSVLLGFAIIGGLSLLRRR